MFGKLNPEMLILAREARGLSQTELSAEMKLAQGLLSKWEHGISVPKPEQLERLATYLEYPTDLFFRPERVRGTDSICFHHRKRKTMPIRHLKQIEAEMHLSQLQVKSLVEEIEIETHKHIPTLDPDEHGGPVKVAQILRAYWGISGGPITNLVEVLEAAGAVILVRPFGSRKLDGMSCWAKNTPPLFFINSEAPTDRMRWTLAHELGHLVMHWAPPGDEDPEVQADTFAQEFLAPADELKPDLRGLSFTRLPALKAYWRISMSALIKSSSVLGVLPPNKVRSLHVQMSRRGWHQVEPYALSPEIPTVIRSAVDLHLNEHGYGVDELAQVACLLSSEFQEKYLGPPSARVLRLA